MKRVFTAPTVTEAHLVKGVLENEGIRSIVKNEHLSGLAGEIPAMEAWPEVWVLDDDLAERAESILARFRDAGPADHLEY
jgi:Putative prokaryotic signal transducing protein